MVEEGKRIHAMMIFEILGRPPEHLTNSLNGIIDQLDAEEGVKVESRNIKEPKKLDEKAGIANNSESGFKVEENEFYVTFADVELEADNIFILSNLVFKYMPAHVEVTSPENITISNGEWGDLLSELVQKLHAYDEVARVMQVEKAALESQIRELNKEKEKSNSESKESKKSGKDQNKKPVKKNNKK